MKKMIAATAALALMTGAALAQTTGAPNNSMSNSRSGNSDGSTSSGATNTAPGAPGINQNPGTGMGSTTGMSGTTGMGGSQQPSQPNTVAPARNKGSQPGGTN